MIIFFKKIHQEIERYRKIIIVSFFMIFFLLGINLFRDYGISFDEPVNRENGAVSLKYVLDIFSPSLSNQDTELLKLTIPLAEYRDKDYGVAFDLPAIVLERVFQINDSRDQYLLRHLLTFIVFFLGLIAIFKTAMLRFESWQFGLLATLFVICSPRIFAESFYNSKDIVFLSCSAIATYTLVNLLDRPTLQRTVIHALVTAISVDIRIAAVIFPMLTIFMLVGKGIFGQADIKKMCLLSVSYLFVVAIFIYILWPWLWSQPIQNFTTAFKNMSRFRWDNYNLYFGNLVKATSLPWHYSPVWIFITTPILYSVFFIYSIFYYGVELVKLNLNIFKTKTMSQDFIFCALSLGPLVSTIILGSTLYDGWRQLYFVYPSIILLSIKGISCALNLRSNSNWLKILIIFIIFSSLIQVSLWMWKAHPYQNVYFNLTVPSEKRDGFEGDYWGLSNLEGLRYILKNDTRKQIKIAPVGATSLNQSVSMIPFSERHRFEIVSLSDAPDYAITNYRFIDGTKFDPAALGWRAIYEIKVDNVVILSIFNFNKN